MDELLKLLLDDESLLESDELFDEELNWLFEFEDELPEELSWFELEESLDEDSDELSWFELEEESNWLDEEENELLEDELK